MLRFGIDVGATAIKMGLFDAERLVVKNEKQYGEKKSAQELVMLLRDMMREALDFKRLSFDNVNAIGLAVPGTVDIERGRIIHAQNIALHDIPMAALLFGMTGIRSVVLNDADAAAFAEFKRGVLKETETSIMITLGTGVGSGLILNGKLFKGGMSHGVELGHMVFDYNSDYMCACGNLGCNDIMCSSTSILNAAKKSLEDGEKSLFERRMNEDNANLCVRLIVDCAKQGDKTSIKIFNEYIDRVGTMINSVIMLLDPEVIAIGGGISEIGDFFFEPLILNIRKKCMYPNYADIVPASVRNDAGILGAALFCDEIPIK